jgi:hypothetical protein
MTLLVRARRRAGAKPRDRAQVHDDRLRGLAGGHGAHLHCSHGIREPEGLRAPPSLFPPLLALHPLPNRVAPSRAAAAAIDEQRHPGLALSLPRSHIPPSPPPASPPLVLSPPREKTLKLEKTLRGAIAAVLTRRRPPPASRPPLCTHRTRTPPQPSTDWTRTSPQPRTDRTQTTPPPPAVRR